MSVTSAPSFTTARSASLSAVSGSARRSGCIASGKLDVEKKTPDADEHRHHHEVHQAAYGLRVLRTRPDEQAHARRTQTRPRSEIAKRSNGEPVRTCTPNAIHPNPKSTGTSIAHEEARAS